VLLCHYDGLSLEIWLCIYERKYDLDGGCAAGLRGSPYNVD